MTTMPVPHATIGWRFWLEWMGVNVAAVALYLVLMIPVNLAFAAMQPPNQSELMSPWLGMLIAGVGSLALGGILGAAQWLVLRKHIRHIGGWVLATAVGYAAPFVLPQVPLASSAPNPIMGMLMLLKFGIVLGVLQWLVLRNQVARSGWWIPLSIGGWFLAFALGGIAVLSHVYVEPFDLFAAAFVPIAVAGAGLVWLLREE